MGEKINLLSDYSTNSRFEYSEEEPPEFKDEEINSVKERKVEMGRPKKEEIKTDTEIMEEIQKNIDNASVMEEPELNVEEKIRDYEEEDAKLMALMEKRHNEAYIRELKREEEERLRDNKIFSKGLWRGRREGFFEGMAIGVVATILIEVFTVLMYNSVQVTSMF